LTDAAAIPTPLNLVVTDYGGPRAHARVVGDRDPFISPTFGDRYGAARVEHFANYGHWLAVEAPEVVAERLAGFFA
jgi:pimeloyl-ACP methyl ester carboxylesterase